MTPIHPHVLAGVRMTTDQMTTQELVTIYMVASQKADPRGVLGYDKANVLFTEANGTQMHAETLRALDSIIGER